MSNKSANRYNDWINAISLYAPAYRKMYNKYKEIEIEPVTALSEKTVQNFMLRNSLLSWQYAISLLPYVDEPNEDSKIK